MNHSFLVLLPSLEPCKGFQQSFKKRFSLPRLLLLVCILYTNSFQLPLCVQCASFAQYAQCTVHTLAAPPLCACPLSKGSTLLLSQPLPACRVKTQISTPLMAADASPCMPEMYLQCQKCTYNARTVLTMTEVYLQQARQLKEPNPVTGCSTVMLYSECKKYSP